MFTFVENGDSDVVLWRVCGEMLPGFDQGRCCLVEKVFGFFCLLFVSIYGHNKLQGSTYSLVGRFERLEQVFHSGLDAL